MIEGNLVLVLRDPHVVWHSHRLGYDVVLHEVLAELHLLSAQGIEWTLRQHAKGYNSWSLWIDGNPIVHLRARRPLDGTVTLLDAWMHGSVVGSWATKRDVRRWFADARVAASVVAA